MAILAAYAAKKADGESLQDYLNTKVFAGMKGETVRPEQKLVEGFDKAAVLF